MWCGVWWVGEACFFFWLFPRTRCCNDSYTTSCSWLGGWSWNLGVGVRLCLLLTRGVVSLFAGLVASQGVTRLITRRDPGGNNYWPVSLVGEWGIWAASFPPRLPVLIYSDG